MSVNRDDTFELVATGDSLITRPLSPYEGISDRFDDLVATMRGSDATVTNLEGLVHDYDSPPMYSTGTYMRAPSKVLDDLATLGVDLYTTATNHSFDYGHGGILSTIDALEERNLTFAGLGRNLFEARSPSYLETSGGRVGLISTCTTIPPLSEASHRSPALDGRPGLNPLRLETIYELPEADIDILREMSESLGIEEIKNRWIEGGIHGPQHDWTDESYFHFMDMKFRAVQGPESGGITQKVAQSDRTAIREYVEEAQLNADWVIVGIHTHEGTNGRWHTRETPAFLRETAQAFIDAGADVIVGHGPHILRGIEIYQGKPIFYSLGNYIVQNKSVTRLPPESFERYGISNNTKPSQVFTERLYDEDREPIGDLADPKVWETVVPSVQFENGELQQIELYPVTLQPDATRPQRGIPILATGARADAILNDVTELSAPLGTSVKHDRTVGRIDV